MSQCTDIIVYESGVVHSISSFAKLCLPRILQVTEIMCGAGGVQKRVHFPAKKWHYFVYNMFKNTTNIIESLQTLGPDF